MTTDSRFLTCTGFPAIVRPVGKLPRRDDSSPYHSRRASVTGRTRRLLSNRTRRLATTALVVALVVVALGVLASPVAADSNETEEYVVVQGDQRIPITPVVDETQAVEAFYDYRTPYTEPDSYTYSSHGTVEYQQHDTSILLLYRGADGLSFVIVHDRLDDSDDATPGGSATFNISGLPAGGEWAVEDDDYPGTDDEFYHHDTWSEMNWVWQTGRTDGGAYRGLDGAFEVTIEPAFGEDANKRIDHPAYDGIIDDWQLISATEDGFERVSLASLEEPVTLKPSAAADDDGSPSAELSVDDQTPTVDETTVTLDASNSEADADLDEYRWDLTGDGEIDRVTDTPIIEHVFSEPGERAVNVTVVDTAGRTDTASEVVAVVDETAPTAVIDAPKETIVGEPVVFDASDSTTTNASTYEWFVHGESVGTTTEPTFDATFDEAGTYEVGVTVTDETGTDTATTSIDVLEPLDARIEVGSSNATVGEPVAFDANASTDDTATYQWSFGDDATANGESIEHVYDTPGEYTVELVVTARDGRMAIATETVVVETPESGDDDESGETDSSGSAPSPSPPRSSLSASPPSTPEPPTTHDATVETEGSAVVIYADEVAAGDTVEANVSLGDDVRLDAVEIRLADDADEFVARLAVDETDVAPGVFTDGSSVTMNATATVESVDYVFSVDREALYRAGVDTSNVTAYVRDDGWSDVDATVDTDGERARVTATVDDGATVAIGANGSVGYVSAIVADSPIAGTPFELTAVVRNTGTELGTFPVSFVVDGEPVANESVSLPPGERTNVSTDVLVANASEAVVRVGNAQRMVSVDEGTFDASLLEVTVEPSRLEVGEATAIRAVVHNDGTVAGAHDVEFTIGDDVVWVERPTVAPGESVTVEFDHQFDSPGTYDVSAGDATVSVTVDERTTHGERTETSRTDEDGSGFGVLAALVALALALGFVGRWRPLRPS